MVATAPRRTFVPQDLQVTDFSVVEPLYLALLERPINSPADLEKWLADLSELYSVVDEAGNRVYIERSCHTDDAEIEKRYLHFVEEIRPKIEPLFFRLQKKFIDSPHKDQLTGPRYEILKRTWVADVEVFREENVPLDTEITKLNAEYDKICGAMMVNFHGKELTLQQLARYGEEPDRATREEAWRLGANRRMQDREKIEKIFDDMLPLREKIAKNADLPDYRAYIWKAFKRFDYTPADCLRFADAIEATCVPLVDEMNRQRQADLKVDTLRPWDMSVDPKNRPPLRPFPESDIDSFVAKTRDIFDRMSPQLAEDFDSLRENKNLDLASRKAKQPGGYQSTLSEVRQPFIFMNAAGMQRDVETLLHEGGHAFHTLAARGEPLVFLEHAPMEFCEVASMTMETLGIDHMDVFYGESPEAARAKRTYLEGVIGLFPWIATIDSFQHWIYTHPGHSRAERAAEWLKIQKRFGPKTDWAGLEEIRASMWQRQLHLFHAPFYYVEYGIAQLGALQVWMKAKEDPRKALANYRAALALGGTRSLPALFSAAGIRFDFSEKTLRPLMNALGEELSKLPS